MSMPDPGGGVAKNAPAQRFIVRFLSATITLSSIAWAIDVHLWLDLNLYPAQFLAAILTLSLPLAFIALPRRRGTERGAIPVYDWIAAFVGFTAMGYLTWEYQRVVDLILLRPVDVVVLGLIVIALSLEGLRRATGNTLPIIAIVFVCYALLGHFMGSDLAARPTDWRKLTTYLALDVNGILGLPMSVAGTIVIAFLLFGQLLNISGGSSFFTDISMLAMGRFRGGPAKIAVVASGLFGSISGSAVANVAATGVVTIPMIKRTGYPAHKAAAIEAVASTGGQLMPPVMGASAFLMAEFLEIPYAEVVLAALIPGVLYYVALFIQADLEAARLGARGLAKKDMPAALGVLSGLYFIVPFAVLIVALFKYNQPPQLAALMAAVLLVVMSLAFGYKGKRPRIGDLLAAVSSAGLVALDIIMVCVAAGIVIGVLGISGLGFNLTLALVQIGEGSLPLLLILSAVVCIILGMGLPTVGVYVLLAALVAPALVQVGIEPLSAHLYVMYFGMMSMITPPVAIAAFAAASIAKADPMKSGWSAVRFGWMAYVVPFLFVMSPNLIMLGETAAVLTAVVTAILGVWLVSIGVAGYLFHEVGPAMRMLFTVAGLLTLIPAAAFDGAAVTDVTGVVGGAALLVVGYYRAKRRKAENGLG
jgi:TRAP transporter 4TM/12TM fusion protein